jgi:hypothetical protein
VAVDASGNIFIAGRSGTGTITITDGETGTTLDTFDSSESNYVARLDSTGAVVWAEGFAEGDATVVAGSGLAVDGAGNVYLAGALYGQDVDFDPGSGSFTLSRSARSSNAFVAKLDANGDFQWATKDDASGFQGTSASSLAVAADGNAYVTIQEQLAGWGWDCGWDWGWAWGWKSGGEQQLAKLDADGAWQWTKTLARTYPDHSSCHDRASDDDWGSKGAENRCVSEGPEPSSWSPPSQPDDNWSHGGGSDYSFPRSQPVSNTTAKVALDSSDNPIVVSASAGATQYDSDGNQVWTTGTPLPVTDIAVDSSGNILFVGNFRNELNVSPDGTYLLDSNTWWKKSAPFIVKWTTS